MVARMFNAVVCQIHLAIYCGNFIEIGRQTPEILQNFLRGVSLPPPALVLYVWGKPCTYMSVEIIT